MSEPAAWKTSREAGKVDCSGLVPDDDEAGKSDYSGAAAHRFNFVKIGPASSRVLISFCVCFST